MTSFIGPAGPVKVAAARTWGRRQPEDRANIF